MMEGVRLLACKLNTTLLGLHTMAVDSCKNYDTLKECGMRGKTKVMYTQDEVML